jgi:hypothetical protein
LSDFLPNCPCGPTLCWLSASYSAIRPKSNGQYIKRRAGSSTWRRAIMPEVERGKREREREREEINWKQFRSWSYLELPMCKCMRMAKLIFNLFVLRVVFLSSMLDELFFLGVTYCRHFPGKVFHFEFFSKKVFDSINWSSVNRSRPQIVAQKSKQWKKMVVYFVCEIISLIPFLFSEELAYFLE